MLIFYYICATLAVIFVLNRIIKICHLLGFFDKIIEKCKYYFIYKPQMKRNEQKLREMGVI